MPVSSHLVPCEELAADSSAGAGNRATKMLKLTKLSWPQVNCQRPMV